jgi:hypothetical protein
MLNSLEKVGQSGQFALPSRRDFHSFRASQRDMTAPAENRQDLQDLHD